MSLSSLIVQREVATTREVEESLARQVLYGGDFLLNLFEIARPDEARLAPLLAELFSLEAAAPGELGKAHDRALALVPADMAKRSVFLPMAVEGDTLTVTVAEPLPQSLENELAFALGVRVVQRVAPAFRVLEAIARDYGQPLDRRVDRLLVRLANPNADAQMDDGPGLMDLSVRQPPRAPSMMPSAPAPAMPAAAPPEEKRKTTHQGFPVVTPEMIAAALKAERGPSSKPAKNEEAPAAEKAAEPVAEEKPAVEAPVTPPSPAPANAAPTDGRPPSESIPPESTSLFSERPPPPIPPPVGPEGQRVQHVAKAPRPARRRRGPLVVDAARRELDDAIDRDTVLDVFFDFTRQFFDYAALFVVHGDLAEGRDSFGAGTAREKVSGIGIPLELPSVLQTTRNKRTIVQATPMDGLDRELMGDLGRAVGTPVAIVPVVVRARVVALLLGDSGEDGVDAESLEQVAAFANLAGAAFERLIVRRKLAGSKSHFPPVDPSASPAIVQIAASPAGAFSPPTLREGSAPQIAVAAPAPAIADVITSALATAASNEAAAHAAEALHAAAAATAAPESLPLHSEEVSVPPLDDDATPIAPPAALAEVVHLDSDELTPIQSVEVSLRDLNEPVHSGETPTTRREGSNAPPHRPSAPPLPQRARESTAPKRQASEHPPDSTRGGHAISVPPHHPPTSQEKATELPSIIVDVDAEFGALVERYIARGDEQDEAELLRQGQRVMPAIMEHFPGPITARDATLAKLDESLDSFEAPFKASDCGPLLKLVARQRRVALPFVLERARAEDATTRFWATFLLYELPYIEAATTLLERTFDTSARIRKVARFAARAIAESGPHLFLDALGRLALDPRSDGPPRLQAIETLGELRHALAVPILVEILVVANGASGRRSSAPPPPPPRASSPSLPDAEGTDGAKGETGLANRTASAATRPSAAPPPAIADDEPAADAAERALRTVTRQDFGRDPRQWMMWWNANLAKNRVEWLIEALVADSLEERRAAGDELRAITKEYFGYDPELARRERERAQQRYRDWWQTEGRLRFRRE